MKIIKAFRLKNTKSLIGFEDENKCIKVAFYKHFKKIEFDDVKNINYYEKDDEYEEISISSFNLALKVVGRIIFKKLNSL